MSAAVSRGATCATVGTINFFETHIGAWEEHVSDAVYERFDSVMQRLRDHRGFRVRQDTTVHKIIRRGYRLGRKGDLEFEARQSGRMFEITFFQNVNTVHMHGGKYDFKKFDRMPRTMQLQCAVEMSHVLRKLLELGYVLEGTRQGITSAGLLPVLRHAQGRTDEGDPLMQFNRSWNFESDWKRGGRFERDASGWPTEKAVIYGARSKTDRDGHTFATGDVMYARHKGRLFRGIARPVPNDQWVLVSNGRMLHKHSNELFRDPSNEPRRFVPKQKERLRVELEKALKANDYRRVETLARVSHQVSDERSGK